jgi:c-di-GMP-binding flagellar brake protein YcgR
MILSDDQSVIIGMCRDISVGGMQVLTDEAPVKVGTLIKLNVSPSTNETGPNIPPFVAEGKVVRILEDGRGFSFRFTKLSDTARKSVEIYIEAIG